MIKQYIKYRVERLKTLDPNKDFNNTLWSLGVLILIISIIVSVLKHNYWWVLGLIVYSIIAYKSVKW